MYIVADSIGLVVMLLPDLNAAGNSQDIPGWVEWSVVSLILPLADWLECFFHQEEKDVPAFFYIDQIPQHQISGEFVYVPVVVRSGVFEQYPHLVSMPCHCGQSLAY